jgi:hypothetical protein
VIFPKMFHLSIVYHVICTAKVHWSGVYNVIWKEKFHWWGVYNVMFFLQKCFIGQVLNQISQEFRWTHGCKSNLTVCIHLLLFITILSEWVSEWVSDCCLTQTQQFFSYMYIIARTSYFSMRWWWCPLCSRSTRIVGFL